MRVIGQRAQQRSRRPCRTGAPLLPVLQCLDGHPNQFGEICLRQFRRLAHRAWLDIGNVGDANAGDRLPPAMPGEVPHTLQQIFKSAIIHRSTRRPPSQPPVRSECAWIASISWLPDKDQPVLAAAIRLRCDVLVTGDRTQFGAGYGRTFDGVTIHSPRLLAEALFG